MLHAVLAMLAAATQLLSSEPAPVVRASVVVETSTLREAGAGPAIALRVRSVDQTPR